MKAIVTLGWLLALASALSAQIRPVQLLAEATVQRENILLSDLLAANADAQLRVFATQTNLGRSPQPGSFRVFTREQLQHRIGDQFELNIPEQVVVRRFYEGGRIEPFLASQRLRSAPPLVEPHVLASLLIEEDAIRIQLRVLPLHKAALGEMVRVLDPASHRVLRAQVAGEGLLRVCGDDRSAGGSQR